MFFLSTQIFLASSSQRAHHRVKVILSMGLKILLSWFDFVALLNLTKSTQNRTKLFTESFDRSI